MATNGVQTRNSKVSDVLTEIGKASLRTIARLAGLSKDAVRRALKSLDRRGVYPESSLWKSEVGQAWLYRLLVAVILEFGLKGGVGANRISSFFHRIHLEKELAVSPNALLVLTRKLENLAITYGQVQEESQAGTLKDIVAAGDETFYNDRILLVAMELGTGYLLMEEDSENRTFETWSGKLQKRLEKIGCHVRYFISDRAQALVKLAAAGLGCPSGADLFHAQQELTRWLGCGFGRRLGEVKKQIQELQETSQALGVTTSESAKQLLDAVHEYQKRLQEGKEKYRSLLQNISKTAHPFALTGRRKNTPERVEKLNEHAREFSALGEHYGIPDKQGRLRKFSRQIGALSICVDAWWLWVEESIKSLQLDPGMEKYHWVMERLLPKVYWEQQTTRADTVELRDAYRAAAQTAIANWQAHPLTTVLPETEMKRLQSWAEWMCRQFQRSSSAVEGRNGCLAQKYHSSRGLSPRRLKALTVLYNYDTWQADGTTPAERLFATKFPDLFEWLLREVGPLPVPRSSRQKKKDNPLILQAVAA
jgi:polyhydroxyalkanoate synthesis regulator phasin